MLFWGFSFVWVKIVFNYYHPITTIFLRLVISSVLLILFVLIFKKHQKIKKEHRNYFLLLAFYQPFLYFLGESFGLSLVSSTIGSVVISTIPVFTPIVAFYMVKERISILNLFGLFVSFAGILCMVFNQDFTLEASPLGILLLFGAVASAIVYGIAIKKLAKRYSSVTIILVQNVLGVIYFLPLFLIFDFNHFITVVPNSELVWALIQLAVFASTGAYLFYIPVVKQLGVNRANIFTNFIPIFTALFSYFLLSEVMNFNKIIGIVIVITGVFLAQINRLAIVKITKRVYNKKPKA